MSISYTRNSHFLRSAQYRRKRKHFWTTYRFWKKTYCRSRKNIKRKIWNKKNSRYCRSMSQRILQKKKLLFGVRIYGERIVKFIFKKVNTFI